MPPYVILVRLSFAFLFLLFYISLPGTRENTANTDLSDILPEDVEEKVKEAAEISMGTEISEDDILNIQNLCDQVRQKNKIKLKKSTHEFMQRIVLACIVKLSQIH